MIWLICRICANYVLLYVNFDYWSTSSYENAGIKQAKAPNSINFPSIERFSIPIQTFLKYKVVRDMPAILVMYNGESQFDSGVVPYKKRSLAQTFNK